MSMHEIEELQEVSIRLLDRIEGLDHRSMFKRLYDFDALFDTGFTHFRVMDILLKRRFYYRRRWKIIRTTRSSRTRSRASARRISRP